MQKTIKILSTVFLFGILSATSQASAATPTSGTVNDYSRLRDSAGFTKVLAVLAPGTKLTIVGEKGVWYEVKRKDGSRAWIAKELVDVPVSPAPAQPSANQVASTSPALESDNKTRIAILKYNANFRKSPAMDGALIRVIAKGTKVWNSSNQGDWCAIKDDAGISGWIHCPLLLIKNEDAGESARPQSLSTSIGNVVTADINKYWLGRLNALRQEKDLRTLRIDESLQDTAAIWADYLAKINQITHDRPGGESMLAWADKQDLIFGNRGSAEGWKSNYFTENLGLRLNVVPTLAGVQSAMDGVLDSFLREGPSGVHYRSLFHPDWNSVGVAWHAKKNDDGKYRVYFVFHYANLFE